MVVRSLVAALVLRSECVMFLYKRFQTIESSPWESGRPVLLGARLTAPAELPPEARISAMTGPRVEPGGARTTGRGGTLDEVYTTLSRILDWKVRGEPRYVPGCPTHTV